MIRRIAYIFACWFCFTLVGLSHGIKATRVDGGLGIVVVYDDGSPVSFSEAKVFAPGNDEKPVLTGNTDRNGCFMFRPDTNGIWKITVDDGMGHAVTEAIQFKGMVFVPVQTASTMPRRYGVITGIALIFGIFGSAAFLSQFISKVKG
ncbi:MAG: hypothetical protein A2283_19365 [Lentisphaerae bacterium RIFOXYA12_FULL_48_11]|nr:MAG: hypothetical protein A2283_19365 [Lentisphaerae bacterium RIFOXYA12_FULL_48_11]